MKKFISVSEEETRNLGKKLAKSCDAGDILCLYGDLGAGKTTFVKGVAQGLKINPNNVHSPTFVLMNVYEGKQPLYHFDLYRLEDGEEVNLLGFEEFLYGEGVSMVEWADRLGRLTPKEFLEVRLSHQDQQKRQIVFKAKGTRYKQLLDHFSKLDK